MPPFLPVQADDPRITRIASHLPFQQREAFEEASGIRQFCGLLTKREAELEAMLDVLADWLPRLPRLFCMSGHPDAWIVATDPANAQRKAVLLGIPAIYEDGIENLIAADDFGATALTRLG